VILDPRQPEGSAAPGLDEFDLTTRERALLATWRPPGPGAGFAARVAARIERERGGHATRGVAAVAALVLLALGGLAGARLGAPAGAGSHKGAGLPGSSRSAPRPGLAAAEHVDGGVRPDVHAAAAFEPAHDI
jgi:hypothetical protein